MAFMASVLMKKEVAVSFTGGAGRQQQASTGQQGKAAGVQALF
jgi:hypothetical protein